MGEKVSAEEFRKRIQIVNQVEEQEGSEHAQGKEDIPDPKEGSQASDSPRIYREREVSPLDLNDYEPFIWPPRNTFNAPSEFADNLISFGMQWFSSEDEDEVRWRILNEDDKAFLKERFEDWNVRRI